MKRSIHLFTLLFILISSTRISAQDIVWANKLLELTDYYQFENNNAELVLGPPTMYPVKNLDENYDPYSEGYIIHQDNSRKKNVLRVGFARAITAKQLVLGGIFNIGSINSVTIITPEKKEKVIYTVDQKATKTKFNTFSLFFPSALVAEIKITIDHTKINEWNLIKGIGVSNNDTKIDLKPQMIEGAESIREKEKVGDNISSSDCFEFNPKLTPDGKTLYFVKECQNQADQDIWYSELTGDKKWSEAKTAGEPLNNKGHNFIASISQDGSFMILGNTYNADGSDAGDGVSISRKKDDGTWSIPTPIKIPGYENLNSNANFFMSADESVLLMAIQDKKSIGDLDLYATFYDKYKKVWSAPLNLGLQINTPFAEDFPYLAPDGQTLFFSSKGYLGYGGHDIYMSKRMDDSWKKWSKPVNMGPMVNSKTDDKGFAITASGDHAYYNTVNFDSDLHHMDIYKVNLPKILRQNPQVLMTGFLFDDEKKTTIRGTVKVKGSGAETVAFCTSNPRNGKYALSIPFGKVYDMQVDAINYFQVNTKLDLTDTSMGIDIMKNFILSPLLDSGQTIVIKNVLFEKNSAKLLPTASEELDRVADMLVQQPTSMLEIGGHTDNVGNISANKILSLDRAKAVGQYLMNKGVRDKRLFYQGYGSEKPIAPNTTEDGRAKNRRVVITYLTKLPQQ